MAPLLAAQHPCKQRALLPRCCLQLPRADLLLTLPRVPTGPQVLKVEGWQALMGDAHLVDGAFTLSDATLAFLWSRMHAADEVKDYAR
jgi:hypothetical protein